MPFAGYKDVIRLGNCTLSLAMRVVPCDNNIFSFRVGSDDFELGPCYGAIILWR
jgi:hypothetical protein